MRKAIRLSLLVILAALPPAWPVDAKCPERPACKGCGCKGGPGYRGPDGRCVGYKALHKICGDPPENRCTFENAPGTGLNQACALGKAPAGEEG